MALRRFIIRETRYMVLSLLLVIVTGIGVIVVYYACSRTTAQHLFDDKLTPARATLGHANDFSDLKTGEEERPREVVVVDQVTRKSSTIVYSCNKISICGGWADRQKGIVSGYVLSVLMDRDFKLDMPRPCDIFTFFQPNEVDWVLKPEEVEQGSRNDIDGIDSHAYDLANQLLSSKDFNISQLRADYVFITSNMELVHMLRRHSLAQAVSWLSAEKSLAEVYHYVLNKLFKPAPTLATQLALIQRSYPEDVKLACAQIRLGSSSHFKDSETFNSLEGVHSLVEFMRTYNHSSRYRILFAADSEQALKIGKEHFPGTFIQTTGPITHVDKYNGPDACAGFGRAILDQIMLSTCDVLVISESGLGKIAAFLRNTDRDLYLFHDSKISVFRRDLPFPNRFYW